MVRYVDGDDNELVDIMMPLLGRRGQHPGWRRVVEQLARRYQRGIDARYYRWRSAHTSGTLGLAPQHDCRGIFAATRPS
jgi:hypothetical protein